MAEKKLPENRSKLLESVHILTTKLYIPPARADVISRPDLVEKLLSGVDRPGCFTLVSGPAGFGKTTLLSELVNRRESPTAWVSLDEGDNDPIRFWTYFIAACQSILDDVGESALELLYSSQQLPDDTIPTLLINDLAAHDQSIVLVLDDYHEIQNSSIHDGLLFLLDYLPQNLHTIVSTRIDPPWPLVRYRARNRLVEIRTQDLRFTVEEAAAFLNYTMGLELSADDVAALGERTEGWIAGLQLAALSIQGRSDRADFIRAFTGSHIYIAEYLIEEILQKQPEDIQLFLLQTSILERMNAGLCEAVTGCQDGQAVLMSLDRANIFIVPLDDEGQWFRYHHLFADLLRVRLGQHHPADEIAALQLRSADWYEQNGFVLEAVNHILAAGDFERAATLVDRAGQTMVFTDQNNLKKWLDALPDESFDNHPRLEIYRVLIALSRGILDMSEETLLEKERLVKSLPPSPENDRLRLEAMVYLSLFMAHQNTSRTIQMIQETLTEVPEKEIRLRAFLFSGLYRAYGMEGDIEKSAPAYRESLRLAQAEHQYGVASITTMVRAFDLCQYGRLDEAVHYCQMILDMGNQLDRKVFYPAGPCYIGLGGIYLERYDLDMAGDYLQKGVDLCRRAGSDGLYTGYLQLARLHQASGELEKALEMLQRLEQTLQRRDFTLTIRQVSLRLAMGDIDGASRLEVPSLDSAYSQQLPLIAKEAFKLCLARIYIGQEEVEKANRVLDEVQATVEPGQRDGRLMEVYLLRALVSEGAISPDLERALELAESAGFVLLLLEEGPALVPLLEAVTTPDRLSQYAKKLLSAFEGDSGTYLTGEADGLIESLTPREMEVLQLVAAGESNQAIADQLVITVRTVKKHLTNILGKLEASNRTQAVARARELGLIISDS